ncbi:MAG: fibronectin type III domain-containing protein [Verrucomicrobia bacterium]|nr:fibronectin type III domain-containing protein [Verrucomicrobiota bacterium]
MKMQKLTLLASLAAASLWGVGQVSAQGVYGPLSTVDYNVPNYNYSPPLTKFVNQLPGLTAAGANNLGQYIPLGQAMGAETPTGVPQDGAYYEIALVDYREQMHSDLPAIQYDPNFPGNRTKALYGGTRMRGYVQIEPPGYYETHNNTPPTGSAHVPLYYADGNPIMSGGFQVFGYDNPHYLGPLILAVKNVPVRIKFYNLLGTGAAGNLYIPVDTTVEGAGDGPVLDGQGNPIPYTQNRATLHLHGGLPSWVSDGTAHQWITPAGENTPYKYGASARNVPDMPGGTEMPSNGFLTFHWPNQQSGRLMFYHDHAWGMTGVDAYYGEAAGYLLVDPAGEEDKLFDLGVPGTVGSTGAKTDLAHLVPLVVQDKGFVWGTPSAYNPATGFYEGGTGTYAVDPLWAKHCPDGGQPGDLWYPHIYVPVQDPFAVDGLNPFGRWHYGPWWWPIFEATQPLPELSHTPETFVDTMMVNGTAYPYLDVQPTKYRFRILNACNDRFLNLQWHVATPGIVSNIVVQVGGTGYAAPLVTFVGGGGRGASASATVDANGVITGITLDSVGSGYTTAPTIVIEDLLGAGTGAAATAEIYTAPTEVGMIPFVAPQTRWPAGWGEPDSRVEGVPDPKLLGPAWLQIGTEGGLLPNPTVISNKPIDYVYDKGAANVLNVELHTVYLGPAERADMVVDFSNFAGKTIILYNDCPAPNPAGAPYYDNYTCDPDNTGSGGAPSTIPGRGPNTRTIMQIRVSGAGGTAPPDDYDRALFARLAAPYPANGLPRLFREGQDAPIVPESLFGAAYPEYAPIPNMYSTISNNTLTFTPLGAPAAITAELKPKAIAEEMDFIYARMNATLGVELPFTKAWNQTTLWYGFVDPPTEIFNDGETQLWKLTHNGVDSHAIHFHLVNVQIVNRIDWNNRIMPPDPEESGWKDTIKMNPLEDIVFAMKAKMATVPFGVPHSVRLLNPAKPTNSLVGFMNTDPLTGNPVIVSNAVTDFGHEYTWHCHLLGHEEYDMMRPVIVNVAEAVPSAPSGLAANYVPSPAPARIDLTWVDNSANETGFRVERSLNNFTSIETTFSIPANATSFSDTSIGAGPTYYYRVIAVNSQGDSLPSNVASATVGPSSPQAPSGLTATPSALSVNAPTVVLRWTDNSAPPTSETSFTVQRDTNPGFTAPTTLNRAANAGTGTISLTDNTVAEATTYYYRVRANDGPGIFSPWSNIAGPVTTAGRLPVAPQNLTSPSRTRNSISLSWSDRSNNEQGFHIWMSLTQNGPYSLAGSTLPNARSFTVNSLNRNTVYYFRVTSFNAYGDSTPQNAASTSRRTLN